MSDISEYAAPTAQTTVTTTRQDDQVRSDFSFSFFRKKLMLLLLENSRSMYSGKVNKHSKLFSNQIQINTVGKR